MQQIVLCVFSNLNGRLPSKVSRLVIKFKSTFHASKHTASQLCLHRTNKTNTFSSSCAVYLPIMCTSPSVQQSRNMLNQRAKLAPLKQQQKLMLLHLLGQPREKFILHKVFPLFMFAQQLSVHEASVYLKIPHLRILHNFFLSEWKITALQKPERKKK